MMKDMQGSCNTEITAMEACAGPHVVRLLEHIQAESSSALILELGDEDLFTYIAEKGGVLTETEAKHVFVQLVAAVSHCHNRGWCHRDIKLENVLRKGETFLLIDFNLAIPVDAAFEPCGTPHYAPPEMLHRRAESPRLGDCWALGIVLFALTVGRFPWTLAHQRRDQHFAQYLTGKAPWPEHLSAELKDLLSRILSSVNRRPNVAELIKHPWLKGESMAHQLPLKKRKFQEACVHTGFSTASTTRLKYKVAPSAS